MKDQVIKCKSKKHGRKIIKYFKSLGVDTGQFTGEIKYINPYSYCYYGVVNNKFNSWNQRQVEQDNLNVIKLPKTKLPENWYCRITEDNFVDLKKWWEKNNPQHNQYHGAFKVGYYVLNKHLVDDSMLWANISLYNPQGVYKEITIDKLVKKTIIGKLYKPNDNSYSLNLSGRKTLSLAGSVLEDGNICEIVSKPYKFDINTVNGIKSFDFVNVRFGDDVYRVLYQKYNIIDPDTPISTYFKPIIIDYFY